MTPPDPQQVAEIAGRLSKAQREAVMGARLGLVKDYYWFEPMRSTTRKVLSRAGLTYFNVAPDMLSPLGLAVRNFIQGNSHD